MKGAAASGGGDPATPPTGHFPLSAETLGEGKHSNCNPKDSHCTQTASMTTMLHFYRFPGAAESSTLRKLRDTLHDDGEQRLLLDLKTEFCFNIEAKGPIDDGDMYKLRWLFTETFEPENVRFNEPFLTKDSSPAEGTVEYLFEVGPRLAFSTAWSSNCSSMMRACGIPDAAVGRVERNRRYKLICARTLTPAEEAAVLHVLHDRMTECLYSQPLQSFQMTHGARASAVEVPVLEEGRAALEQLNKTRGLGFDDWDLDFYTAMFRDTLQRNPTDVECFDLAQSNSEHSRHWFFGGRLVVDGVEQPQSLFQLVKSTLQRGGEDDNSVIAFHDNSSAIRGYAVPALLPTAPGEPSPMTTTPLLLHPLLTAETHNFPTAVAPFAGAETGTGGRLRDVQATGRGAHSVAGISAYCVGRLPLAAADAAFVDAETYPPHLATPMDIIVEASNGASDYGNKYGEPVVAGFARSFGQRLAASGERIEWLKPVMFTAGVGLLDDRHAAKGEAEPGLLVCKVGGPAYRIGMGGGAASSRSVGTGDAAAGDVDLDFDAVQRGDAEMENRLNRLIRACVELGDLNPIVSIHDQGAGGNGNVLKELTAPHGAEVRLSSIARGDESLSALELWGAEYQENNALLVAPGAAGVDTLLAIARREQCPVSVVGAVGSTGRMVVVDDLDEATGRAAAVVADLPLALVLGDMPRKVFASASTAPPLAPLRLPTSLGVEEALTRVCSLLDVGSKRFLTNKVDRSVGGLVAQQQCVGPLHTPLSNVAVLALSHFSTRGMATAVGEQPIKGLVSPAAQARLTVCEALANLSFADVDGALGRVKASGNWMWAAKLPGEARRMLTCAEALRDALLALGVGIDGGKDSLSMAVQAGGETVKAPGQLTLTVYAACADVTATVTPDLKRADGVLLLADLSGGQRRLGGSALSTALGQLGDACADVDDVALFGRAFAAVQQCVRRRLLTAGHDRSDGGLLVLLTEMAIAGDRGFRVALETAQGATDEPTAEALLALLFNEEPGFVFECAPQDAAAVADVFAQWRVPLVRCGESCDVAEGLTLTVDGVDVWRGVSVASRRALWEETSLRLEARQCQADCVRAEREALLADRSATGRRRGVAYAHRFALCETPPALLSRPVAQKPQICVLRQEGTNGDREMLAACHAAGLAAWDVNMHDLLTGRVALDRFRGVVFCGGFSYADVNDSAKGWAAVIRFQPQLLAQFAAFRAREDTFSLGVCNGCQLMALLGWVPFGADDAAVAGDADQPRFVHNRSGRFESRWSAVVVQPSPAVLLRDMAGSTLGVWVAHGEGRALFPRDEQLAAVEARGLAPLRYVDEDGAVTETYPHNPNGSPRGIAALCSPDGRHLAMMPHPERCFRPWQLPCAHPGLTATGPADRNGDGAAPYNAAAPWMQLFHNARRFCEDDAP